TLTADSTIAAIVPEDERSTEYQNLTGLPEIGTAIEATDLDEIFLITFYDDGTVRAMPTPQSP
ncbi:MAG: hypothetical protein O3A14_10675, partial [Cyanobacteria bacterium]|nr:hypothetical protein [Cyanobacteriota bacterium]